MQTNTLPQNHMEIYWHDYASQMENINIRSASLTEKASIIGRTGLMLLSCGTGAWRVRSSMNSLAEQLNITCTANIGLMSIDYTCFDGDHCFSQSLCLTNTGVNTSTDFILLWLWDSLLLWHVDALHFCWEAI